MDYRPFVRSKEEHSNSRASRAEMDRVTRNCRILRRKVCLSRKVCQESIFIAAGTGCIRCTTVSIRTDRNQGSQGCCRPDACRAGTEPPPSAWATAGGMNDRQGGRMKIARVMLSGMAFATILIALAGSEDLQRNAASGPGVTVLTRINRPSLGCPVVVAHSPAAVRLRARRIVSAWNAPRASAAASGTSGPGPSGIAANLHAEVKPSRSADDLLGWAIRLRRVTGRASSPPPSAISNAPHSLASAERTSLPEDAARPTSDRSTTRHSDPVLPLPKVGDDQAIPVSANLPIDRSTVTPDHAKPSDGNRRVDLIVRTLRTPAPLVEQSDEPASDEPPPERQNPLRPRSHVAHEDHL